MGGVFRGKATKSLSAESETLACARRRYLGSALESEFFGGKPKKREALQERASLTATKLLLYGAKKCIKD